MKTTHVDATAEKKGHLCPPSSATHPSDRWESLFVYAFICKFTNLRGKIDGLNSPMEFEESLLTNEPNLVLTQILARFVLSLKPQTRNLSSDQISSTVAGVMAEFLKTTERTVFWNEDLKVNVDPFQGRPGGLFSADWDFKLKVLRQLVEFQLCHSVDIKRAIDIAWGVGKNTHRKKDPTATTPAIDDGPRLEDLHLVPIGQDLKRRRYWVIDDSPRIYYSTNPWKITATFQTVSSNKIEYEAAIASLRADAPPEPRQGEKRPKTEQMHHALIKALEDRTEAIDAELNRIQRARRKVEQRNLLLAQADLRETRTRQRARPNYAYINDPASGEEDFDEYKGKDDEDDNYQDLMDDEQFGYSRTRSSNRRAVGHPDGGMRRSSRTAATTSTKSNGKRGAEDDWTHWRGERRSTRLGAPDTTQDVAVPPPPLPSPPPPKRARTDDSSVSAYSETQGPTTKQAPHNKKSAAALKPTEYALEQVAGKKKSKYWFYAVEPVAGPSEVLSLPSHAEGSATNGGGRSGTEPPGTENEADHQPPDDLSELSGGDE